MPDELAARYRAEGWWTDESVGQILAEGLTDQPDLTLRFFSETRPWSGTFADGFGLAQRVAGALRERGVGPARTFLGSHARCLP